MLFRTYCDLLPFNLVYVVLEDEIFLAVGTMFIIPSDSEAVSLNISQ